MQAAQALPELIMVEAESLPLINVLFFTCCSAAGCGWGSQISPRNPGCPGPALQPRSGGRCGGSGGCSGDR